MVADEPNVRLDEHVVVNTGHHEDVHALSTQAAPVGPGIVRSSE
jgi:hypothetical protein